MAGPGLPRHHRDDGAETGDTADYRTTSEGIELEVLDADEKRLAMLFFRWDEVAPLLRGLYARQLDGFGQEQIEPAVEAAATVEEPAGAAKTVEEPAAEAPAFHSETVAVYPGDKNHLPYDVVVERLHFDRRNLRRPNQYPLPMQRKSRNTRSPFLSTASGRLSPTRGQPSRRPIRSIGTICAATLRTSILPTIIWVRAAPRPSTRPMWRQSSC